MNELGQKLLSKIVSQYSKVGAGGTDSANEIGKISDVLKKGDVKERTFKKKKKENKESTGSGSAGGFEAPLFSEPKKMDSMFKDEQPKTKVKGGFVYENEEVEEKWSEKYKKSIDCKNPKGFSQRAHCQGKKKKIEANEMTGSGSSGSFEGPAFGAKSMSPKDWGPKRKTQIPGGQFVEVKKKCKTFPYCNQGIGAINLTESEVFKNTTKKIAEQYNVDVKLIQEIIMREIRKNKGK
jgi:hypothetical protein